MWLKVKRGLKSSAESHQQRQEFLQVPDASAASSSVGSSSSVDTVLQPQPKRLREWRASLTTFLSRRKTGPAYSRSASSLVVCSSNEGQPGTVDEVTSEQTSYALIPTAPDRSSGQRPRPSSSIVSPLESRVRTAKRLKVQSLCLEQETLRRAKSEQTSANSLPARASPDTLSSLDNFLTSHGDIRAHTPATICEVLEASRASSNLERDEVYMALTATTPPTTAYDRSGSRFRSRTNSRSKTYCEDQRSVSLPGHKQTCQLADYGLHQPPLPALQQIADFGHRRITSA